VAPETSLVTLSSYRACCRALRGSFS